jgi:hypothetical protein
VIKTAIEDKGVKIEKLDYGVIVRDEKGRIAKGTNLSFWKGKKFSVEHRKKLSETQKVVSLTRKPRVIDSDTKKRRSMEQSEYMKKRWADPKYRQNLTLKLQNWSGENHDLLVKQKCEALQAQGFRCVPIGLISCPRPDIIAIKDGKVVAVEIERRNKSLSKYEGIAWYDDVIWDMHRINNREPWYP